MCSFLLTVSVFCAQVVMIILAQYRMVTTAIVYILRLLFHQHIFHCAFIKSDRI